MEIIWFSTGGLCAAFIISSSLLVASGHAQDYQNFDVPFFS